MYRTAVDASLNRRAAALQCGKDYITSEKARLGRDATQINANKGTRA